MGFVDRLVGRFNSLVKRSTEGAFRPGPYWLPVTGGWLDDGGSWNWWQKGGNIQGFSPSALVEACVSAYSQTVAMCPGDHWVLKPDNGRERVTTSALSRVMRKPNAYQSTSDFLLDAVRDLYMDGNCYALALRNQRFETEELHLFNPRQCAPMVAPTGDVFYALSGNDVIEKMVEMPIYVPARDVVHIRMHTSHSNMLVGQSPIVAAIKDIAASDAITSQQLNFYLNAARPSVVLSTDMVLEPEQVQILRDRWNEQVRGLKAGGTPILTAGLKPVPISTNAVDAQLAEVMKMTDQHIALAFRIPLQILGISNSAALGSTEVLMQTWIASGLGFCLNHLEEAFGNHFNLKGFPDEYLELNTDALLRSEMKSRVESAARGVQGGIYSPNEARAQFGLPKAKDGDEPRVQQQVVPLSAASKIPAAPGPPAPPSNPPAPAPKDQPNAKQRIRQRVNAGRFIASANKYDRTANSRNSDRTAAVT